MMLIICNNVELTMFVSLLFLSSTSHLHYVSTSVFQSVAYSGESITLKAWFFFLYESL